MRGMFWKRKAEDAELYAESLAEYEQQKAAEDARRAQITAEREREMREGLLELPRDDQGPFCARCHGRQFEAKRDAGKVTSGVLAAGVGALLVPRNVVECVTCGARYRRG